MIKVGSYFLILNKTKLISICILSCLSEDAVLDTVDEISENTSFLVSTADDGSRIAVGEFVTRGFFCYR
jgi:hypothetical protein